MPSTYQIHGQSSYSWQQPDGLKNLRLLKDVPKPTEIPAGHALVRIRAAALNARDWMGVYSSAFVNIVVTYHSK